MIDWGRPALYRRGPEGGITAFADHADPQRFYYLPDRPRIRRAVDGQPEVRLLRYHVSDELRGTLGAGLLTLTAELAAPEELLRSLRSALLRTFNLSTPPTLEPVVPESATARLLLLDKAGDAEAKLVERILSESPPSLYGGNPVTFLAVLPEAGTEVVAQCLRGGELPAGIVYALNVVGIRPALRARIEARWNEVYEFLEDRMKGGALLVAVDVGPTIEELIRSEHLRVQIDHLVPDDQRTAAWDAALEHLQVELIRTFLVPTLGEAPLAEGGQEETSLLRGTVAGLLGAFTVQFSLRKVERSERKTATYDLSVARAETRVLSVQAGLPGLFSPLPGEDPAAWSIDRLIVDAVEGAERELRFDIGSAVDLAAIGVDRIELSLSYGDRAESFVLDAAHPTVTWSAWYEPSVGAALRWRYVIHFREAVPGGLLRVDAPERSTVDRVVRFHPLERVVPLDLRLIASTALIARYPSILVDLRLTGVEPVAIPTLELNAAHVEAIWTGRVEVGTPVVLEWRRRYFDTTGTPTEVAWERVEPGLTVLEDPRPAILDVQVLGSARFGTHVARLIVELRPASRPQEVGTLLLDAAHSAATWSMPVDGDRAWSYRVTVHSLLGEVTTGDWTAGDGARLVVGEGIERIRPVELRILGKRPADLGLLAVKLRFSAGKAGEAGYAEWEALVEEPGPVPWTYAQVGEDAMAWTWQVSLIHADGSTDVLPAVTTRDQMAVYVLRAPG